MCLQACEFTTTAGIGYGQLYRAPRYGSAARATLPARRRTSHGSGCPPTLAGPAAALGAARSGAETHDETVAYGSRGIRVASEPTVGRDGLSSGRRRRGDAPRQQQRQRDRSSGRDDVSGCSRPCLIAYYDLASFRYSSLFFSPAKAKAKLKSGPTTTNLNMARLRSGPRPARWPRKQKGV